MAGLSCKPATMQLRGRGRNGNKGQADDTQQATCSRQVPPPMGSTMQPRHMALIAVARVVEGLVTGRLSLVL